MLNISAKESTFVSHSPKLASMESQDASNLQIIELFSDQGYSEPISPHSIEHQFHWSYVGLSAFVHSAGNCPACIRQRHSRYIWIRSSGRSTICIIASHEQ
jgi:hypothetical protein